jgi:predicted HAD superfamily Cof-like phosphohydrolase
MNAVFGYYTNNKKVKDFMKAFGQEVKDKPGMPNDATKYLRVELIEEELVELKDAIKMGDIVEIADALTDILYVTYGAGHAFGIDLDECFREVHQSNMSKLDSDGKPIYRDDGKVLKGPYYHEPNLAKVLNSNEEY